MTIQDKVKAIAERVEGVDYLFENWAKANIELDDIERPTIVYILPASGTMSVRYNAVTDAPMAQIAVLSPTELDFDSAENDDIIEMCKDIFVSFLRELNKGEYFEPIEGGDIPYQVVYDKLDVNTTGIIVTLALKELQPTTIC